MHLLPIDPARSAKSHSSKNASHAFQAARISSHRRNLDFSLTGSSSSWQHFQPLAMNVFDLISRGNLFIGIRFPHAGHSLSVFGQVSSSLSMFSTLPTAFGL